MHYATWQSDSENSQQLVWRDCRTTEAGRTVWSIRYRLNRRSLIMCTVQWHHYGSSQPGPEAIIKCAHPAPFIIFSRGMSGWRTWPESKMLCNGVTKGVKAGMSPLPVCRVAALCVPIWHVSSSSGEACYLVVYRPPTQLLYFSA